MGAQKYLCLEACSIILRPPFADLIISANFWQSGQQYPLIFSLARQSRIGALKLFCTLPDLTGASDLLAAARILYFESNGDFDFLLATAATSKNDGFSEIQTTVGLQRFSVTEQLANIHVSQIFFSR